jgi:hypothetical protein
MVLIIPMFSMQFRIRVYCLVCVMHTLRSGYWFLPRMYRVCSLCLVAIDLSVCPTYELLPSVTFESVYPAGICAGLNYFVSEFLIYSVCDT